MFIFGFELILVAALLAPAGGGTDLVSQLSPSDYFKFREIDESAKAMLALAGKEPKNARAELQQLLAIRWLGENKDKLGREEKEARELLDKLASAKEGFAKEYAQIALARLDGMPLPILNSMPKDSLRSQAFEWFPDSVTLFGSIDFRPPPGAKPNKDFDKIEQEYKSVRSSFFKLIPPMAKEEVYKFAESVGNFRVDRISFGIAPGPNGPGEIYVRLTGQGNLRRIAKYLASAFDGNHFNVEEREKENIVVLTEAGSGAVTLAFIGDTDLVFCFDARQNRSVEMLEKVLKLRLAGKGSLPQGPFGKALAAVPGNARGIFMGIVPEEMQRQIAQTPLGICPKTVAFELLDVEGKPEFQLKLRAVFESEEDAQKFAKNGKDMVQMGIDKLGDLPPGLEKQSVDAIRKALQGIEISVDKTSCYVVGVIDFPLQKALVDLFGQIIPQ